MEAEFFLFIGLPYKQVTNKMVAVILRPYITVDQVYISCFPLDMFQLVMTNGASSFHFLLVSVLESSKSESLSAKQTHKYKKATGSTVEVSVRHTTCLKKL